MPVTSRTPMSDTSKNVCVGHGCCNKCWGGDFGKKILLTFFGVLLVYLIFFVGTLVRNNIKKFDYIGRADKMESTIMVNGVGRVNGSNDIAMTTIGYSNTDKDVAKAQTANKKVMDQIMAELKKMGVAEKDMQTNYTVYPDYDYTQDKGQILKGYKVSNQLTVKIRDLSKVTQVLGLAGKYGATEVGGLNFAVDDSENLKSEARTQAIADAKSKASFLAKSLGVRLGRVVSYNEYEASPSVDYYAKGGMMAEGGGGAMMPEVASGSKEILMNVQVNYEILP